jgi:dipeptidyl aminopeptidase/acylaminoacyl peptidase
VNGLPAQRAAQASVSYDAARILPQGVFWVEGRHDGRDVLVRWTPEQGSRDVIPAGFSVASRVHEYGGGAWTADGEAVWFCNASDQRLYHMASSEVRPASWQAGQPGTTRYADLTVHPGGNVLWSVRERHQPDQVVNDLVAMPLNLAAAPRIAASGQDFYAFPRPSPDGTRLAWTSWDAPQMPWDGTCLHVAEADRDGNLGEPVLAAGGRDESVFQPEWSPDGILHFLSDRSGWWGLYTWKDGDVTAVWTDTAELGVAQWEFGYSTYAFLDPGRIAVIVQRGPHQSLNIIGHGQARQIPLPYTSIKPYLSACGNDIALIASNATTPPAVVTVNADDHAIRQITQPRTAASPATMSEPEPFSFTAHDGTRVHGLYYRPWDPAAHPPPLVVKAHPGPTANVQMRLDWHTQYLASLGFAVAEIDYRGSTGYGRAFRNALRGTWGNDDALDCAQAARHLAGRDKADPSRTVIWGASAGGYTALRAAILTPGLAGCIARSPVIDPRTWRQAAPKFQAHQTDNLIGPWPEQAPAYQARSVLHNAQAITCPVLLLHGAADPVTPASQSRELARKLGDLAQLAVFPDEGHTLRSPRVLQQALELERSFLHAIPNPPQLP